MTTATLIHPNPPPFIHVRGSHRAIGQQLGEALKSQISHSREIACGLIEHSASGLNLKWEGAAVQAQKYLPFIQERYPQYVDELSGMAEGSGISFGDLCVLTTFEAVTSDALHLGKCTSMALTAHAMHIAWGNPCQNPYYTFFLETD